MFSIPVEKSAIAFSQLTVAFYLRSVKFALNIKKYDILVTQKRQCSANKNRRLPRPLFLTFSPAPTLFFDIALGCIPPSMQNTPSNRSYRLPASIDCGSTAINSHFLNGRLEPDPSKSKGCKLHTTAKLKLPIYQPSWILSSLL